MKVLIEGGKARDEKLEQLEQEVDQVKVDVATNAAAIAKIESDFAEFGIKLETVHVLAEASQEDIRKVAEGLLGLINDKESTTPKLIQFLSKKLTKNSTKASFVDIGYIQGIVKQIEGEGGKAKDKSYIQKHCHLNREHEDEEEFEEAFSHAYIHGHESEKDRDGHPKMLGPKKIGLEIMPRYLGMYQREKGRQRIHHDIQ